MSGQVLWYAARVSGLMAVLVAWGALISGLLVRSQLDRGPSPARAWADEANRFLGLTSLLFTLVHGAAVVAESRFDLAPIAVLIGRQHGRWVEPALLIGVGAGWLVAVTMALRLLADRLPRVSAPLSMVTSAAVVVAGTAHGWEVGSDIRNPVGAVVLAMMALVVLVMAGLAFGATGDALDTGRRNRAATEAAGADWAAITGEVGADHAPTGPNPALRPEIPLPELRRSRLIDRPPSRSGPAEPGPDGSHHGRSR